MSGLGGRAVATKPGAITNPLLTPTGWTLFIDAVVAGDRTPDNQGNGGSISAPNAGASYATSPSRWVINDLASYGIGSQAMGGFNRTTPFVFATVFRAGGQIDGNTAVAIGNRSFQVAGNPGWQLRWNTTRAILDVESSTGTGTKLITATITASFPNSSQWNVVFGRYSAVTRKCTLLIRGQTAVTSSETLKTDTNPTGPQPLIHNGMNSNGDRQHPIDFRRSATLVGTEVSDADMLAAADLWATELSIA